MNLIIEDVYKQLKTNNKNMKFYDIKKKGRMTI